MKVDRAEPDPEVAKAFLRRAPFTMGLGAALVFLAASWMGVPGLDWKLSLGFGALFGVAQFLYGRRKLKELA